MFDQINWLEIVKVQSPLTIVIPPVTIRELNKHKDFHDQPRVKRRAGKVLKRLSVLFDSNPTSSLRDQMCIQFEDRDPAIDFAAYQLIPEIQDDQLIASIIMHRDETPEVEVVLITADAGLELRAKAKRLGIVNIKMPDNLRSPEEPDPAQQKIRQQEQEIRDLKARIPRLTLTFENETQNAIFTLPTPVDLTPDRLERQMNEIKRRYPKKNDGEAATVSERISLAFASPKDIARHNTELDEFYRAYEFYLKDLHQFENFKCKAITVDILLVNSGTAPADDIDIILHFPDGLELSEEGDLPQPPSKPKPPIKPRSEMQILADSFLIGLEPAIQFPAPYHLDLDTSSSNVSVTSIKRTNSYEVKLHAQRVKHGLSGSFDPLYVVFDSFEKACSFHIDYQIFAANVPQKTIGKLHVVIQKA